MGRPYNPEGQCSVELKSYPQAHAFAGTSGSDNIVAFTTQRYHTQSLIVQGPGAGPEVTAPLESLPISSGLLPTSAATPEAFGNFVRATLSCLMVSAH